VALLKRALTLSLVCSTPGLTAPLPSSAPLAPNPLSTAVPIPLGRGSDTQLLERSWQKLDAELRALVDAAMKGADGNYLRRQPLRELPAVYLLTPSVESVNRLIDDFRAGSSPAYRERRPC